MVTSIFSCFVNFWVTSYPRPPTGACPGNDPLLGLAPGMTPYWGLPREWPPTGACPGNDSAQNCHLTDSVFCGVQKNSYIAYYAVVYCFVCVCCNVLQSIILCHYTDERQRWSLSLLSLLSYPLCLRRQLSLTCRSVCSLAVSCYIVIIHRF